MHQAPRAIGVARPRLAVLRVVVLTALLTALTAFAAAGPAGPLLKLRVGQASAETPLLPNAISRLAADLGFYEREGLDVEILAVNATPALLVALRTGDVDVANVATEDSLRLTATKGMDLRAIHSPDARLYFLIASRTDVPTIRDLRGKTFAVARPGSLDYSLTDLVLQSVGMDINDLRIVPIGGPAVRAQALLAGRVDATTFSVGTWTLVRGSRNHKILVDSDTFYAAAPLVSKVNAALLRTVREKPEHLRRFTAAIIKASRYLAENKQAWVDTMAKRRPDVSRNDLGDLWEFYKTSWAVNGLLNLGEYVKTADFLYQTDDFKQVPKIPVWDWVDTRFVDATLKDIGVYAKFDNPGRTIR